MKSTVAARGQVVIPKALRVQLGLKPGQQIDFAIQNGRLIGTKVMAGDPVGDVSGILKLGTTVDQLMTALRGPGKP